ncbi:MAG: YegP family protein [Isosphaeraceae bacterium]
MGIFTLKKSSGGKYYFELKAGNNETILVSEMYQTKASAKTGIQSVKANARRKSAFVVGTSLDGKVYFNLKATNGKVIGTSETYESALAMVNGMDSIKSNAKKAVVVDLTKS